ncbi:MAG: hypothetical protein ACWGQW_00205 [bacterium]
MSENCQEAKLECWMVMHGDNVSFRVRSNPDFPYIVNDGDDGVMLEVCEDGEKWTFCAAMSPAFYRGMMQAFEYFHLKNRG